MHTPNVKTCGHVEIGRKPTDSNVEPYVAPADGIIAFIPTAYQPYAQLVRLDKPGFVYFFYPHLFGALLAATYQHTRAQELTKTLFLLLFGSIPLTFVNYAWNDALDADFDARVKRTVHRPVARGAISKPAAFGFTVVLALLTASVLLLLPTDCALTAVPLALGAFIYPLSKRYTNFPQLVFGPVIASGVFMGAAALGVSPLAQLVRKGADFAWSTTHSAQLTSSLSRAETSLWTLFAANTCWAVCYELVYSFQDVADDEAAGVGTMTTLIRDRPKPLLSIMAAAAVAFLSNLGSQLQAGSGYFIITVVGVGTCLVVELWSVRLTDPESCIWWFSMGGMATGAILSLGLLCAYSEKVV